MSRLLLPLTAALFSGKLKKKIRQAFPAKNINKLDSLR